MDCSLLGTCDTSSGVCSCKKGWTGSSCSRADVAPLDITKGYQNHTTSSWGGRAFHFAANKEKRAAQTDTRQKHDAEAWYLLVTEIAERCPLILFEQNSQVALTKSVSGQPEGPYEHVQVVFPPFHHNPTFVGPTPDGQYLSFFIGADNASNTLNCTGGVPPGSHQEQVHSNNYITMAWTENPVSGPWQQRVILDDTMGNQSSWHCES